MAAFNEVHGRGWIQAWYETGSDEMKARASAARKLGYRVVSQAMGSQVTNVGRIRLSLLDIRPGRSGDSELEGVPNPGPPR